jgi:hypothetical protein
MGAGGVISGCGGKSVPIVGFDGASILCSVSGIDSGDAKKDDMAVVSSKKTGSSPCKVGVSEMRFCVTLAEFPEDGG